MQPRYFFVIPYRNRPQCLATLLERLPSYLNNQPSLGEYHIVIVEQDEKHPFNLGMVINVGFAYIRDHYSPKPDDVFIFHPVDAIPLAGSYEVPESGFMNFCTEEIGQRYGKAHGFRVGAFEKMNGYSNEFWGWGSEDEDMHMRLEIAGIPKLDRILSYEFLMNHGWDTAITNRDTQDAYFGNVSANLAILKSMHAARDTSSGLSNLKFTPLSHSAVSQNPPIEHIRIHIAPIYDDAEFKSNEVLQHTRVVVGGTKRVEVPYLQEALTGRGDEQILLVGEHIGNEGVVGAALLKPCAHITTTDVLPLTVPSVLSRIIDNDSRVSFVHTKDFVNFEHEGSYDLIAAISVLEHFGMHFTDTTDDTIRWNHDLKALEKMMSLLRNESSKIVVTVPIGEYFAFHEQSGLPWLRPYNALRRKLVKETVAAKGFRVSNEHFYYSGDFTNWVEADETIFEPQHNRLINMYTPNAIWAFTICI